MGALRSIVVRMRIKKNSRGSQPKNAVIKWYQRFTFEKNWIFQFKGGGGGYFSVPSSLGTLLKLFQYLDYWFLASSY